MSESQKKLFKGQNTHPLSQAEKQALAKKIKFNPKVTPEDKKKVYAAFKEMMDYPTGREQIRKAIAFEKKEYVILVDPQMSGSARGGSGADGISVSQKIMDDPKRSGITLLHEILHQRQHENNNIERTNVDQYAGNISLAEAETNALNLQLECESGCNPDIMYKEAYEKSLDKWRQVANGKQPRPKNIPALTYEPNLTVAEKAETREAYAQLLASLECRGTATKEFAKPMSEFDENLQSYHNLHKNMNYMRNAMNGLYGWGRETNWFKNPQGDPEGHNAWLKDIVSRNPLFVSVDDLKKATISGNNDKEKIGFMTIAREAQDRFSKGEGECLRNIFDKIIAEKQAQGKPIEKFIHKSGRKQLSEFFEKEGNPAQEGITDPIQQRIKLNEAIMKTDLIDDAQKREELLYFIRMSKDSNPEPREDRTDAIKKLREMTGNPNLPIVKTSEEAGIDSQMQEALRKAGKPVPQEDNQTPITTPDKSLMA